MVRSPRNSATGCTCCGASAISVTVRTARSGSNSSSAAVSTRRFATNVCRTRTVGRDCSTLDGKQLDRTTPLDREWFSYIRCEFCDARRVQWTIDTRWFDKRGGEYLRGCWQCYWTMEIWRRGPICNCGPMWDGVDHRRNVLEDMQHSSPS